MQQLSEVISKHTPGIATYITSIIFIIFLILNISDDFDKIKQFVKRMLNFRKHVDTLIYSNKRGKYNDTLSTYKYLDWQNKVIQKIYGVLIEEKQSEFLKNHKENDFIPSINLTKLRIGEKEETYESITLRLKPVEYPFDKICDKELLERKPNLENENSEIKNKFKKEVNRYYRLIKQTIKYPDRLGYMLNDIVFDENEQQWHIEAHAGVYKDNIKTSHILEYELYKLYVRDVKNGLEMKEKSREEILDNLPIRKYIHDSFKNEKCDNKSELQREANVLTSGRYRESLLGVQVFVMVKNRADKYDILRIRRSTEVAAKPEFIQFIPSGGFEAANDCTDMDSQWDNYSITKSVFRELLEECFGIDEDDKNISANNVSPDKIYNNKHIIKLVKYLRNEDNDYHAYMQLMGTSMNLVGLRQELSFILKIDDPDFSLEFIGNYESKSAIHMIDVNVMEKDLFWDEKDLQLLNCTSAGLYELARQNELYKTCLK